MKKTEILLLILGISARFFLWFINPPNNSYGSCLRLAV